MFTFKDFLASSELALHAYKDSLQNVYSKYEFNQLTLAQKIKLAETHKDLMAEIHKNEGGLLFHLQRAKQLNNFTYSVNSIASSSQKEKDEEEILQFKLELEEELEETDNSLNRTISRSQRKMSQ